MVGYVLSTSYELIPVRIISRTGKLTGAYSRMAEQRGARRRPSIKRLWVTGSMRRRAYDFDVVKIIGAPFDLAEASGIRRPPTHTSRQQFQISPCLSS